MTKIWQEYYEKTELGIRNLKIIVIQYKKCRLLPNRRECVNFHDNYYTQRQLCTINYYMHGECILLIKRRECMNMYGSYYTQHQ